MGNSQFTLQSYGKRVIQIIKDVSERSQSAVKFGRNAGQWFLTTIDMRQGHPLSPCLFNTYLERGMDVVQDNGTDISVQGVKINNVRFAVDIDMVEENVERLKESVLEKVSKTKAFGIQDTNSNIFIENRQIEHVANLFIWEHLYMG